jgi:putative endonuclease
VIIIKKFNYDIGKLGEDLVINLLKEKGYYIFERNFFCTVGEIDIIAKIDNVLCFVEVKSRYSLTYGYPRESITSSKINKIKKSALWYISKHKVKNTDFRFDVAEVYFKENDKLVINIIENAF